MKIFAAGNEAATPSSASSMVQEENRIIRTRSMRNGRTYWYGCSPHIRGKSSRIDNDKRMQKYRGHTRKILIPENWYFRIEPMAKQNKFKIQLNTSESIVFLRWWNYIWKPRLSLEDRIGARSKFRLFKKTILLILWYCIRRWGVGRA